MNHFVVQDISSYESEALAKSYIYSGVYLNRAIGWPRIGRYCFGIDACTRRVMLMWLFQLHHKPGKSLTGALVHLEAEADVQGRVFFFCPFAISNCSGA